jgi:serine/threonine protein kinase
VAKLCDFGSAVTSINVEDGTTFRLKSVTPPWDAPESTVDIDIDDIDKVDFYGYGLIACRVALEGGDPFAMALSEVPAASDEVARNDVIKAWKTQDQVSEICKSAIRHAPGIHYTQTQHETLSNLMDNTARTRLDLRADEYREIKALLKPEEVSTEDDW